jgi:hypothetical protein
MLMLTGWAFAGQPCEEALVVGGRVPQAEQGLVFRTGSAELLPEAEPALQRLACLLDRHPELSARVEVYSDPRGSETYNLRMSQARAEAVRGALARWYVSERVTAVGYGESTTSRVEVYAGPAPGVGRPPAPVPAPVAPPVPVPVPVPVAPVDWCARARTVSDTVPTWADAICAPTGLSWSCATKQQRPQEIAEQLSRCGQVLEDGGVWYAKLPAGTLVIAPWGQGSDLRWR